MGLPVIQLKFDTHTFSNGETVEYRELSRAEAIEVRLVIPDVRELEILAIMYATRVSRADAEAWYKATPTNEVDGLVKAITKLSGLDEDTGKDAAGASLSAKSTE